MERVSSEKFLRTVSTVRDVVRDVERARRSRSWPLYQRLAWHCASPLSPTQGLRWRMVQAVSNMIWRRWLREYLPNLTVRHKWNQERTSLQENDLVIIKSDDSPRSRWPLARVIKVFPGSDGRIRSAELKTKTGTLILPVSKLCVLEGTVIRCPFSYQCPYMCIWGEGEDVRTRLCIVCGVENTTTWNKILTTLLSCTFTVDIAIKLLLVY